MYRMMARLKIDSPERADLNGSTDLAPSAPPAVVSGAKQRRCIG
jgi:hypothetical protein